MPPTKSAPLLDPIDFFTGESRGEGRIKVIFQSEVPLRVQSRGIPDGKGGITVNQQIAEGDKPARFRHWIIRPTEPGSFTGMLTDATGPVSVAASGNTARIGYTMSGGLEVRQQLVLADDRRTIRNRLIVSKWGIPVATVDERIRKLS